MKYDFDPTRVQLFPVSERTTKSPIADGIMLGKKGVAVDPDSVPPTLHDSQYSVIEKTADNILKARGNGSAVMLAYGAHSIKNGLGPVLRRMAEEGFVTHLATNGAGVIHDWEFAYMGKTEEDVRENVAEGKFGTWHETTSYLNMCLLIAAYEGKGYGESISEMVHSDMLHIPSFGSLAGDAQSILSAQIDTGISSAGANDLYHALKQYAPLFGVAPGEPKLIPHPFKQFSVLDASHTTSVPLTVHPQLGHDIIYTNPGVSFAAIGRAAQKDWNTYCNGVFNLDGGVYLSVGSAIMSPMIFEKALSMARNVAIQDGRTINDFAIVVNDIQEGNWKWGTGDEPPKSDAAYYLRFCKTFDRMGARDMDYVCADNKAFVHNLYHVLHQKAV